MSDPDFNAAIAETASAALLVQSYCNSATQQPDISMPADVAAKMPPINTYLGTARTNARIYLDEIQPKMISVISDVGGYSSEFIAFYNLIKTNITRWEKGDTAAKTDALALLKQLRIDLEEKKANVIIVRDSITNFHGLLNTDVQHFNECNTKAESIIGGDEGAIASYENLIGDINGKISGAATGVALSCLGMIGGLVLIVVGAVASCVTGGAAAAVIVGGVALLVVGTAGVISTSIILHNLLNQKAEYLETKANLEANLIAIKEIDSNVKVLKTQAETASSSLTSMHNAWTFLGDNLGNVISDIDKAQKYSKLPITTRAFLETASLDWQKVGTSVDIIEQQLAGVSTVNLVDALGRPLPITGMSADTLYKTARKAS